MSSRLTVMSHTSLSMVARCSQSEHSLPAGVKAECPHCDVTPARECSQRLQGSPCRKPHSVRVGYSRAASGASESSAAHIPSPGIDVSHHFVLLLLWTAASRQRDTGWRLPPAVGARGWRPRQRATPAPGGCASRRRGTEVRRARERRLRRVPDRRAEATPSTGVRVPIEPLGERGSGTSSGGDSTTRTTGSTPVGDTTTYDSAR